MLFNLSLFVISVCLYIVSPEVYSEPYIIASLVIFFAGVWHMFRNSKEKFNILSFNVIFLLSFFFCTYSYAVFVIGAGVNFSMTVLYYVNFDLITKAVLLSTVAITVYFLAYSYQQGRRPLNHGIQIKPNILNIGIIGVIRTILFIGVLVNFLYYVKIKGGNSFSVTSAPFLPELYKEFLIIYLLLNSLRVKCGGLTFIEIIQHNKKAIAEAIIICLLYLVGGDRGLPISIVFIFLGVYSFYYRRLKVAQFAIIAIAGLFTLFALRVTRGGDNSISEAGISAVASATQDALAGQSAILLFSDLMGTSTELCLGYEYVQKNDTTMPGKVLILPFYPFPFLPSLVGKLLYGKVPYEMSAGYILNDYIGKKYGYKSNLGNHIVIDIYIHWGLIGVIVLFTIFGRLVCYIERNKFSNIFIASSYILILSFALYLPRDSVFTIIRPIIFLWIFDKIFKLTYISK